MFTGIVEEAGRIHRVEKNRSGIRLWVCSRVCAKGTRIGDSIAVNGCCLTVVSRTAVRGGTLLRFDILQETWNRTNLRDAPAGAAVNLERSLRADGRLGGHFVTGHIDGTGRIVQWERRGADHLLDIEAPAEIRSYLVTKGSVAVDGISLTVAAVARRSFRIWIIPHTYEVTALCERQVGDAVNLEADLLGKYVARFLGKA
jgi:riboflavin synthase